MSLVTTFEQQREFEAYEDSLARLEKQLGPWAPERDQKEIKTLRSDFQAKVKDLFREGRHLNIGVVGQVKAGKSSFLNTLLFDGRSVLPKAATPKTAVLTQIVWDSRSSITVRYLSADAWAQVLENAQVDDDDEIFEAARELADFQRHSGIDPEEKLGRTERLEFESPALLQDSLNDFVGENGRYTPLVESVTLGLPLEELRDLTIVDTPGLNDPVVSRTVQTREFLKVCDVVFFLSQSGSFLDSNDWELLSGQLPQKGVKRLVLVASKADSALLDVLRTSGGPDPLDDDFGPDEGPVGILEALEQVRTKLAARASAQVRSFCRRMGEDDPVARAVSACAEPIPISAMLENMRRKPAENYDREEQNIYRRLEPHFKDPGRDMERIGNFALPREIFQEVIQEKEDILFQKGREVLPTAISEQKTLLSGLKDQAIRRLEWLERGDVQQLKQRLAEIKRQENGLKGDVSAAIGEALVNLEQERSQVVSEMRRLGAESGKLTERTGSREVTTSYIAYRHHFLFFRWGKETRYSTHTERYRYLVAADAVEQIRDYATVVASNCEDAFRKAIRIQELKRKLLNAVVVNLDASNEHYDAGTCRLAAERVLNEITFPELHISFEEICQSITTQFTGEITSSSEQDELRQQLAKGVAQVLKQASDALNGEVDRFRNRMTEVGDTFTSQLLKTVQEEYQGIMEEHEQKASEIQRYQRYAEELESILSHLT